MEFKEFEYLMRISFIGAGRVATHLASALCEQHQIIRRSIATGGTSDLDQVIAIVQSSGALDYCRQRATEETEAAITALEALPDSESRRALKNLALLALHRIQ